jgi:hypothetical protein
MPNEKVLTQGSYVQKPEGYRHCVAFHDRHCLEPKEG